jgi:hypothetical protein
MPRPKQVKITKDDQEAFVQAESVKAYERHGWTVADDGDSEVSQQTATEQPTGDPDPQAQPKTAKEG